MTVKPKVPHKNVAAALHPGTIATRGVSSHKSITSFCIKCSVFLLTSAQVLPVMIIAKNQTTSLRDLNT